MPGDILKKRKIAVLGSRSVGMSRFHHLKCRVTHWMPPLPHTGKSSLVIQFTENHFVDAYYPTIESTFSKTINFNGVDYECDIIDTAGQVR